jgi:hypothetical protein
MGFLVFWTPRSGDIVLFRLESVYMHHTHFVASPVTLHCAASHHLLPNKYCVFMKLHCMLYTEYLITEIRWFSFVVFSLPVVSEKEVCATNVEKTEITFLQ